jgi:hypothetical protein
MSTARQRRRGTTAQHSTFTGLNAEITVDTDKHVVVVHDGLTAGGFPLALATSASPVETQIHAATGKTTPVDADEFGIVDTAASNVLKKLTWANLKATLWTAWGALIAAATGKTTPVDADTFAMADSAASNATKKLTWANLKATLNTYFSGLGSLAIVAGDIVYGSGAATLARLAKGSDGQVLTLASGVPAWATASAAGVTARNRLVNPAMQISSINGNTSGTTSGYSPADNWTKFHVSSAGTLTVQRVQSVTPKGAKDRIRLTVTVADASLAAGEFLTISQNMIGQEVADFQYGSASAKQGLLRFLFKAPAGTYAIHLGNSATNRSYVALFTISAGQANTDTIQTFTIPGDTTGTWLTDTGTGITLDIVLACGSTFQGTTGWQAGNLLGTSGVSNGMATGAAVFEIGEAGFYLDVASLATFPTWELPSTRADVVALGPVSVGAAVATTSGTSIDFTSIPPWAKRVTLMFVGVSTSGTSRPCVRIGDAGGIETSGYNSFNDDLPNGILSNAGIDSTSFALSTAQAAVNTFTGTLVLVLQNASTQAWLATWVLGGNTTATVGMIIGAGSKTLSPGPLDRVRLTTLGGTDTFDAGEVSLGIE